MKILQWNVWYKENIDNILGLLKEVDADVICLQEITDDSDYNTGINTATYLADKLEYNLFYKDAQTNTVDGLSKGLGNAILSKSPIVSSNFFHIQEPTNPEAKDVDYSKEGRLYSEITVSVNNREFTIGTTHMSYTDAFQETSAKRDETDNLLKILKGKTSNFLITGDFNVLPDSYTVNEIQKMFKNVGPPINENTWTTKPFSYNGFEAKTLDWRLDYCFATADVEVISAQILKTEFSDHLPILIELKD